MMEDPKTGGALSIVLIWFGAVYDYLAGGIGNISILVGIALGVVTIYCTLARHFREEKEYAMRMMKYKEGAPLKATGGGEPAE